MYIYRYMYTYIHSSTESSIVAVPHCRPVRTRPHVSCSMHSRRVIAAAVHAPSLTFSQAAPRREHGRHCVCVCVCYKTPRVHATRRLECMR